MSEVTINGVKLYYEVYGEGEETVILNNGVIANTASWAFLLKVLTPYFQVVVYDMRGQGQSQKWQANDPSYTWDLHVADLAGLMDALEIEQAHIAGISYGGELTLHFALQHPKRCKKLVVADSVSHVEPYLRAVIENWIAAARTGDHEFFYHATWFWNFSEEFFADEYAMLSSRAENATQLDLPSVIQLCECFNTLNITEQLGDIQQPTCVIVGEKDMLKPPHYAQTIADLVPHSEYHMLPHAGHASFWETVDAFNTIVLGFLLKK